MDGQPGVYAVKNGSVSNNEPAPSDGPVSSWMHPHSLAPSSPQQVHLNDRHVYMVNSRNQNVAVAAGVVWTYL